MTSIRACGRHLAAPAGGVALVAALVAGCGTGSPEPAASPARHLVLVTIDTLRADRLGAYGHAPARTPVSDALAARGARFERAFATAPITLPSHASLLTGRYPPAHGARHNGMSVLAGTPTLAGMLGEAGFATAAFVAAFPLDRRFGLAAGFETYGDRLPRGAGGRPANERAGQAVVDEATAWLAAHREARMFLWVHLFEPHAPYGTPGDRRPVAARYDDEVAEADRQVGRLLDALGSARDQALVVVTGDHGEAFGEHGEIGHSVFAYDTTLRVPLVMAGPGVRPQVVAEPVGLVDVLPTALALLGLPPAENDGVSVVPLLAGGTLAARALYAESFAPLLDFGWSPLRTLREAGRKYIAAPRPELYDLDADPGETRDLSATVPDVVRRMAGSVERVSTAHVETPAVASDAARRLQSLGYVSSRARTPAGAALADPKDRRELAARLAQVTSGELSGAGLEAALRAILAADPGNPQAHLRLGFVLAESNRCRDAQPHFTAAIDARLPTADAHLGLAGCLAADRQFAAAERVLTDGLVVEPENPVVVANQGVVRSDAGRPLDAVPLFERALALDPDFLEARFQLAVALARGGRRQPALEAARALYDRLPADAPQRPEVLRLISALQ